MSLLDIFVTRDRATVAADSLAYSHEGGVRYWPDGTPMHVAKIVSLPQATAALTGRNPTTADAAKAL